MLIVFDLDFTLWNAGDTWCDHTIPPYRKVDSIIKDAGGSVIYLYPDVIDILKELSQKDIPIALASRTYSPDTARKLLDLFGIRSYFQFEEIYPSSKLQHFQSLHKRTLTPYEQIYFFDDEQRNIVEVGTLGVNTFLVNSGLNWREMKVVPGLSRSPSQ